MSWGREMAQKLRSLAALPEDWAQLPAPTGQLAPTCNSRFQAGSYIPSSGTAHTWCTDTHPATHMK